MTLAELLAAMPALRAFPPGDPRWDRRALEIFVIARGMAFAARPLDEPAPDAERYWSRLDGATRNAWTIEAWQSVTGEVRVRTEIR